MKAGYTIENNAASILHGAILVSNYHMINEVVNMPVASNHPKMRVNTNRVGMWKIKKLK